jgi:hypothetical protein
MSLSEKLAVVSNKEKKQVLCKLGQMLVGGAIPAEDRDHLVIAVMTPSGDPRRISSIALAAVLQEEGHNISGTSITTHRLKRCSCFRVGA